MKLYEYQAKDLFKKYSIPIPEGKVAFTKEEAEGIFKELNKRVAVKAQVHVGGRGKAGGVKLADNAGEVKSVAGEILGMDLKSFIVDRVLVEEAVDIDKEFYVSFIIDRAARSVVFIASAVGGVDIEDTAKKFPEKITKIKIDSFVGMKSFQARRFAVTTGVPEDVQKKIVKLVLSLYMVFRRTDANLVEINPLVVTKGGDVIAADAKFDVDDNALYRQKDIYEMVKKDLEKHAEHAAQNKGLSYVKMEGNIGCVVNGAGLSMATMDIIKLYGGVPANFLDIGGSSNPEKVKNAMKLLIEDKNVKVVFFNIFGGITRCDDVAAGLVKATEELKVDIPIIIRLTGTKEKKAKEILKDTKLIFAETMDEAAKKAVELIR